VLDDLGVGKVVDDDLAHLREVPSVPFLLSAQSVERPHAATHLDSHRVDVDLLVQVVEQGNGLDDHRVDLVRRELELESGHRVTETEGHGVQVLLLNTTEERRELLSDTSVKVLRGRIREDGDGKRGLDRRGWA